MRYTLEDGSVEVDTVEADNFDDAIGKLAERETARWRAGATLDCDLLDIGKPANWSSSGTDGSWWWSELDMALTIRSASADGQGATESKAWRAGVAKARAKDVVEALTQPSRDVAVLRAGQVSAGAQAVLDARPGTGIRQPTTDPLVLSWRCNRCEATIRGTIDELVKLRVGWLDVGPISRELCTGDCTRLGNPTGKPAIGWDSRFEDGTIHHMPHAGLVICAACIAAAPGAAPRPDPVTDLRYRLDGDLIRVVIAGDVIAMPMPAGRAGWSMSGFGAHIDAGWLLAEGALPGKTKARREALANILVAALTEHNKRMGRS